MLSTRDTMQDRGDCNPHVICILFKGHITEINQRFSTYFLSSMSLFYVWTTRPIEHSLPQERVWWQKIEESRYFWVLKILRKFWDNLRELGRICDADQGFESPVMRKPGFPTSIWEIIPLTVERKGRTKLLGPRERVLGPTFWAKFLGAAKPQLVLRAEESHSSLSPWKWLHGVSTHMQTWTTSVGFLQDLIDFHEPKGSQE